MIPCAITVVGDGHVGKTCLLLRYVEGKVPEEYVPTVFELYRETINRNGVDVQLQLLDTAGQEEYEKLRVLSYHKCDVFLLCFDVTNSASLDNCKRKWNDELRSYSKKCPIILVGTKFDLLKNEHNCVRDMGKKMAKSIKAADFILTSAKDGTGVTECFDRAINLKVNRKKKRCCIFF